ncbi:MAG: DUF3141 domain-containing protein [Alphaproteobacteria bacterium]|nr:DUF3141 domain-containing protein [Alphaproteobacteria bacterium]
MNRLIASKAVAPQPEGSRASWGNGSGVDLVEYAIDAVQRGVLYLDVLRKRGNQFIEHFKEGKPPVLAFDYKTIMDGRQLERPVNYALLRIIPKEGTEVDPTKRPFVIFDPRAGHGPGIGGFKEASQVGVAMRAGHPCYFVSFFPDPVPGQTIEDVGRAEVQFVQKVIALHPDAEDKPAIIGNCQAGWAIMLMSAAAPNLPGVICIAGSPLSYWAGAKGQNPMRYAGGMLGGSWTAALASDLGAGRFDGVSLVSNFENLNPSNTLWTKQYHLYANVDTEEQRYLEFDRWWGGHFFMTGPEIRFIVDELFVGNKLARGDIALSDGRRLDLKNIRAPIVVIASWGDNITPPQQALNWILDLYRSVDEMRANEQVIVYSLHETIGHLGIFVSAKVALKEHAQFVNAVDLIEILPPGLYEMVIEERRTEAAGTAHEHDSYVVRFEERTLDDIRVLDDGRKDEETFETVARVSEINEGLYDTFVAPWVRMVANPLSADLMRLMQPSRIERLAYSDLNPAMWGVKMLADMVRQQRQKAAPDNALIHAQEAASAQIEKALDGWRDLRDGAIERLFYAIYDSPPMRAIAGLAAPHADARKPRRHDEALEALLAAKIAAIRERIDKGGFPEAVMRILMAGISAQRAIGADGVAVAREAKQRHPILRRLTRQQVKAMAKEQAFMLAHERQRALDALPKLLPTREQRRDALAFVHSIVKGRGRLRPEAAATLRRIEHILEAKPARLAARPALPRLAPPAGPKRRAARKQGRTVSAGKRPPPAAEIAQGETVT